MLIFEDRCLDLSLNKKVLLRERVRHTDRSVFCPSYPSSPCQGVGYRIQSSPERVPHPVLAGRGDVPHPTLARGPGPVELLWDGDGVPPERTWDQWKYYRMEVGTPWKGHGTSGSIMEWRWCTPPPPVDRQRDACKNVTSTHPSDAVGNNYVKCSGQRQIDHSLIPQWHFYFHKE